MATFTITIPDGIVQDVVEAFCVQYKRPELIADPENPGEEIPNPVSKVTFAKSVVRSFVREVYTAVQIKTIEATRLQIIETANTATDAVTVD